MSSPREPRRDLRLERLGDRNNQRPDSIGEAAHVGAPLATASSDQLRAAYEALIDAVFTAPGAAEWLFGLRLAISTRFSNKESAPRTSVASDAIQTAPQPDGG